MAICAICGASGRCLWSRELEVVRVLVLVVVLARSAPVHPRHLSPPALRKRHGMRCAFVLDCNVRKWCHGIQFGMAHLCTGVDASVSVQLGPYGCEHPKLVTPGRRLLAL